MYIELFVIFLILTVSIIFFILLEKKKIETFVLARERERAYPGFLHLNIDRMTSERLRKTMHALSDVTYTLQHAIFCDHFFNDIIDDFIKNIELNAETANTPLNILCKNIDKKQFMKVIEDHIASELDQVINNASSETEIKSTVSSVILPTIFIMIEELLLSVCDTTENLTIIDFLQNVKLLLCSSSSSSSEKPKPGNDNMDSKCISLLSKQITYNYSPKPNDIIVDENLPIMKINEFFPLNLSSTKVILDGYVTLDINYPILINSEYHKCGNVLSFMHENLPDAPMKSGSIALVIITGKMNMGKTDDEMVAGVFDISYLPFIQNELNSMSMPNIMIVNENAVQTDFTSDKKTVLKQFTPEEYISQFEDETMINVIEVEQEGIFVEGKFIKNQEEKFITTVMNENPRNSFDFEGLLQRFTNVTDRDIDYLDSFFMRKQDTILSRQFNIYVHFDEEIFSIDNPSPIMRQSIKVVPYIKREDIFYVPTTNI